MLRVVYKITSHEASADTCFPGRMTVNSSFFGLFSKRRFSAVFGEIKAEKRTLPPPMDSIPSTEKKSAVVLLDKSEFAGLFEPRNVPELCSGISCRSDATAFHPGACRDFIHAQRGFH